LTIYVQADPPPEAQRDKWLGSVIDGSWTPPAVQKVN
jgi:hypothetical protein